MKIEVKARTFFEVRQGEKREALFFRTNRVISINNISFPAEPPPISAHYLNADNVLVLYFDDVDAGPNAMTQEQAKAIVDFALADDPRPIFIHCTAGISRSGAVGSILNWYFNRFLEDNQGDYLMFEIFHPDIVPNAHVRRLLLRELESRHHSKESAMQEAIELRAARKRLAETLAAVAAEKLLAPRLKKWFESFDCICYSTQAVSGDTDALRFAESKFLRIGCGTTHCGDSVLVVDIKGDGKMHEVFAQMTAMVTPESYEIKGQDAESFFVPFLPMIRARAWKNYPRILKLLQNNPKDAAISLLAARRRLSNMFSNQDITHYAKKFDELYERYVREEEKREKAFEKTMKPGNGERGQNGKI